MNRYGTCEFELLHPKSDETDVSDEDMAHPDTAVVARAHTLAASRRSRRFLFFEAIDTGRPQPAIFPIFEGQRNEDGSAVILQGGKPIGWYTSVASARRRLMRPHGLFLAWLEPEPASRALNARARNDTEHGTPDTWCMSISYIAYGGEDARAKAIDVVRMLTDCLPGPDAATTTFGPQDSTATSPVFGESPSSP